MTLARIEDFEKVIEISRRLLGNSILMETWIPKNRFRYALYSEKDLTLIREDAGEFGFAFGPNPTIPKSCSRLSVERIGEHSIHDAFTIKARWDVYSKEIAPSEVRQINEEDRPSNEEVQIFLQEHAPDSSVMPGHREIVTWAYLRDGGGLVGVAAICRWESGHHVVASVATHSKKRGIGLGKSIMIKVEQLAAQHRIGRLSLGVMADNASAKRLYENAGYTLLHEFTYGERS